MKLWLKVLVITFLFGSTLSAQQSHKEAITDTTKIFHIALLDQLRLAQLSSDTLKMTILANELKIFHSKKSNFDSIYFYNEVLISIAITAEDFTSFIDAQRDNYFMDAKFGKNADNKLIRISALKKMINNSKVTNFKKRDIAFLAASYYYSTSNSDSLLFYQKKAIELSDIEANALKNQIVDRIQLGVYLENLGRNAEALKYLTEAEPLIDGTPFPPFQKIKFLETISKVMINLDDPKTATFYIEEMTNLIQVQGFKSFGHKVADLKGIVSSKQGDHISAEKFFKEALSLIKNSKYDLLKGVYMAHLANEYYFLDDIHMLNLYLDSIEENKYRNSYTDFSLVKLRTLYHLKTNQPTLAYKNLQEVNQFKKNHRPIQMSIASVNQQYYSYINDSDNEIIYLKRFMILKDSLAQDSKDAQARRIEASFNREKQAYEITSLKQKSDEQITAIARRNKGILFGGIALAFLSLLLFSLLHLYRKNQLQNKKLGKALGENQMLIKEIHHRVKNNLQVISSLLNMQARKVSSSDVKDILNISRTRVQAMGILHQNLYAENNLKGVAVDIYFNQLIDNIFNTYQLNENIELIVEVEPLIFDIDVMVPLGLIANELITNVLKHAFKDQKKGVLSISLLKDRDNIVLQVKDNGVGFEGADFPQKEGSIGARLINSFTKKLKGDIKIIHDKGMDIQITFNKKVFDKRLI